MNKYVLIIIASLSLAGCQTNMFGPKVYGRYVPERKDDFAWENEYAAFRMYGPALADENPSNGVDLWLKNSPALVIDTMYARELKEGRPYHVNYDGNLDCYKVGHTAGAGGLVIVKDNGEGLKANGERANAKVYVGGPYSAWQILEQTNKRFSFKLHYDSLPVEDQLYEADMIITAEAGNLLNKAQVVLKAKGEKTDGEGQMAKGEELLLGGGIFLHDTMERAMVDFSKGAIAYAENALSDKHAAKLNYIHNHSLSQGRSYIAVVTPGATITDRVDGTFVSVRPYTLGDTLTYYFGGCWSKWRDGKKTFRTDEAWFKAIDQWQEQE